MHAVNVFVCFLKGLATSACMGGSLPFLLTSFFVLYSKYVCVCENVYFFPEILVYTGYLGTLMYISTHVPSIYNAL